jgi:hypothetical protein
MAFENLLAEAKKKAIEVASNKSNEIIASNLPKIQALFKEKVESSSIALAKNDAKMTEISKGVYGALPAPVKLILTESVFVEFCLKNRSKVIPNFD